MNIGIGMNMMLATNAGAAGAAGAAPTEFLICAGCEQPIFDRFLLNVLDRSWHAECVSCAECRSPLQDKCFFRDGRLFCRNDFFRRFGTRCAGCGDGILPTDLVRKARDKVFHVRCFVCAACHKQLATGEELHFFEENKFLCRQDYVKASKQLNGARAGDGTLSGAKTKLSSMTSPRKTDVTGTDTDHEPSGIPSEPSMVALSPVSKPQRQGTISNRSNKLSPVSYKKTRSVAAASEEPPANISSGIAPGVANGASNGASSCRSDVTATKEPAAVKAERSGRASKENSPDAAASGVGSAGGSVGESLASMGRDEGQQQQQAKDNSDDDDDDVNDDDDDEGGGGSGDDDFDIDAKGDESSESGAADAARGGSGAGGGALGGDMAGVAGGSSSGKRRGPRTTIKAKQLETLKAAFAATPKPTRHIREQLAHETGLNMRVIQVWFQNRRSKERRMKQLNAIGAVRRIFRSPSRGRLRQYRGPNELDPTSDDCMAAMMSAAGVNAQAAGFPPGFYPAPENDDYFMMTPGSYPPSHAPFSGEFYPHPPDLQPHPSHPSHPSHVSSGFLPTAVGRSAPLDQTQPIHGSMPLINGGPFAGHSGHGGHGMSLSSVASGQDGMSHLDPSGSCASPVETIGQLECSSYAQGVPVAASGLMSSQASLSQALGYSSITISAASVGGSDISTDASW